MEFRDLKQQYQVLKNDIDKAVLSVMPAGQYIGGQVVKDLEQELADYVGVKHCISCANGTDALSLVMMAWGLGPGDAIFVPDFTFFSTAEIVSFAGAQPIFVDICPETFNMDPLKLEKAIESVVTKGELRPKAVIPVDLFGLPANYPEILPIAEKYGLKVLCDSAQGFGGAIEGRRAGSFGDVAITSFFPAKPLGCYGDGGAVFTNDDDLAGLIGSLKVHGKGSFKYDNVRIGINSRLDTLQAAILHVKLRAFADYELDKVNAAADYYRELLAAEVTTPVIPEGFLSSYAQFTLKLKSGDERNFIQQELKKEGIPTMVYYPIPMHKQTVYAQLGDQGQDLSVSLDLSTRVLSLPMHPYLTRKDIEQVSSKLLESRRKFAKC